MGPMAELLMKHITVHKDIEIISRGLIVLFPEPVNPKAIAVMRQKGIILDNRTSVALTEEDIPSLPVRRARYRILTARRWTVMWNAVSL